MKLHSRNRKRRLADFTGVAGGEPIDNGSDAPQHS